MFQMLSKVNGIFSPPVHISPQPHFVREVPHQHPHHPKTRNPPTNPLKVRSKSEMSISIRPDGPVLRVFGHLENVESNVHKANVCSQL